MRILVTGGAGFIGSHLCDRLIQDRHEVTVLDNLSTGNIQNLAKIIKSRDFRFIEGSILDTKLLNKVIKKTDYVFHLAAAVGVFNIINNPLESLVTNIRGTENILEYCNKYKIPVFITSSSEVYGKNASDSLGENDDRIIGSPTTLRWSYSEAKAIDESLAYAYFLHNKLEVRIVRFFNTVGPRQIGNYGMVLPRLLKSALENKPLTIYGDGNQTRCFAHIGDVIDAVLIIAFSEKSIGSVINIGNDSEISITELAHRILSFTGSKSEIVHLSYHEAYGPGFQDMERRVPNLTLINQLYGWRPKRDLTNIIHDMCKHFDDLNYI